ncbi:hypothetical protein [Lysobacter sp. Root983]|uniref:hypothetical protein n=1 Tax=Lysobacter sp. Root983 TaxID=1736613 RepID=UPI000AEC8F13|nr:hypothetical protein [Lysobacter sp. Root983]
MSRTYPALIAILLSTALLTACGPRLSGADERAFDASRAEMEATLNPTQKIVLEKALRVVVLKAMSDKAEHPEQYRRQSFNAISLKLVDGQSYAGIVELAEDHLKAANQKDQARTLAKIAELEQDRAQTAALIRQLDAFQPSPVEISMDDFMGEDIPFLDLVFRNRGDTDVVGEYAYSVAISSQTSGELLDSQQIGGTFSDDYAVAPGAEHRVSEPMPSEARAHSKARWQQVRFPLKDAAQLDLVIKVETLKFSTRKGTVERPKRSLAAIDAELRELHDELKALGTVRGSLDELELSDESTAPEQAL